MTFQSLHFLFVFLPVSLVVYRFFQYRYRLELLSSLGIVFYTCNAGLTGLAIMMTTVILTYLCGLRSAPENRHSNTHFYVGLSMNIGTLLFFKYIPGISSSGNFILPIGLSFSIFRNISYLIDVYNESTQPGKSLKSFLSFSFFFPQLLSGPIVRKEQFFPQLSDPIKNTRLDLENAIFPFVIGLSKKVIIADHIGLLIAPYLKDIGTLNFTTAWILASAYAIQIYFDFSGYTDMAISLGRLLGIELPPNFDRPYFATNPSEFWNRWHMTLAFFLRDYIFTPLSIWGMRNNITSPYLFLIFTMLIGGMWHGNGSTYVVWGLLHGCLLIVYHRSRDYWNRAPVTIQRIVMLGYLNFTWVFFRSENLHDAFVWTKKMVGLESSSQRAILPWSLYVYMAFGILLIIKLPEPATISIWKRLDPATRIVLATLAAFAVLNIQFSSKFLYIQF